MRAESPKQASVSHSGLITEGCTFESLCGTLRSFTKTHTCIRSCVWEAGRVSEEYCFIRANFIQLLSDNTPCRETHLRLTSRSELDYCLSFINAMGEKKNHPPVYAIFYNYRAILIQSRQCFLQRAHCNRCICCICKVKELHYDMSTGYGSSDVSRNNL